MSQADTMEMADPAPCEVRTRNCHKAAAVLYGNPSGPIIAAAKTLSGTHKIGAALTAYRSGKEHLNPFIGFTLFFPFGDNQAANENTGFGVQYKCEYFQDTQTSAKLITRP